MSLALWLFTLAGFWRFSLLKARSAKFEKLAEGVPLLLVEKGKTIERNIKKARITYSDVLQTARESQGLERIGQIKYAVLETFGSISIIPMEPDVEEIMEFRIKALDQNWTPCWHGYQTIEVLLPDRQTKEFRYANQLAIARLTSASSCHTTFDLI